MNSRPKQPKYARNKNILVIGGSGSGKTRFFVKPNLMQMHSSYVVTDPKGTVLVECGKLLQRGGYRIKVLNTINFKKSMKYNPFAYLRSEKDILKLVNTLIANTKGDGEKAGEDFWVKSERLFYCALMLHRLVLSFGRWQRASSAPPYLQDTSPRSLMRLLSFHFLRLFPQSG